MHAYCCCSTSQLVAYVVNGAVSSDLGAHPKVVPIPLGISVNHSSFLFDTVQALGKKEVQKKKLLVINTKPTPTRCVSC